MFKMIYCYINVFVVTGIIKKGLKQFGNTYGFEL